jgi:hypothetical protein
MKLAIVVLSLAALTGCESMVAPRYSVNADNNVAIKALAVGGVSVGKFSGPANFDPNCRLVGALQTADGLTHTQYLRRAFEEEFKLAGIYATSAPRVVLSGRVTNMEFSSTSSRAVTGGVWTIELTLTSSNGATMSAAEKYEFTSGFIAQTACKQTAEAFTPAVQNLVGKFVRSPEFARLVGATRGAAVPGAAAAPLTAAQRVESGFWESIRGSADPSDFRAYLEQYPSGTYAATAREQLAALTAVKPRSPALRLASGGGLPAVGDAWTYRLTERRRSNRTERDYVVKIASVSATEIVEHSVLDEDSSGQSQHGPGAYLVSSGASVFSPYLAAFTDLTTQPALGMIAIADPVCSAHLTCDARASVVGREVITVPAGRFETIKVKVEHGWRGPKTTMSSDGGLGPDSRELLVWYAPAVKRAVKFSSRVAPTARRVPFQANFDLELVSYQVAK